ncbi:putative 28S rRNA (cytosine-C(5))-methyltransferase [Iris pallida]|uniref:28S rRNA (Cytosine-C(5))-methyltransferase n=1 Tax=Iris pallida TaxID=29817 RepID=A0AAX6HME2_IRIPA|nr:putative 28S rRNA (cytosine-C(5))-methyltransferase [Iris pallida]
MAAAPRSRRPFPKKENGKPKSKQQKQQQPQPAAKRQMRSRDAAERSAYFARREAAAVLRKVLVGDATRRASASIKSLVYGPTVRNKKATFALICQTLKYLPVLKELIAASNLLSNKWKKQEELIYVTTYDILFGQEVAMTGTVEKFLMNLKDALQATLAKLLVRENAKSVEDLLRHNQNPAVNKPRYIRVNTLKMSAESAMQELEAVSSVVKDDIVPDLLVLPSGTDLHHHPLVASGGVFLQGKASSMVAAALCPKPGWDVLDACAAPGNKTIHLAALMEGKGNIIACELHKERVMRLEDTIRRSGAPRLSVVHGDFLDMNATDSKFSKVRAILLDPSCSGSGITTERLDYLLPSYSTGHENAAANTQRVEKLAAFQTKALSHALSFPAVERVVYSTCSIHRAENEDVIKSVLPFASSLNFELATPFPKWPRRGLPVFEGAERLLRTDPAEDTEGFFIALFVRKCPTNGNAETLQQPDTERSLSMCRRTSKRRMPLTCTFKKMLLYHAISQIRTSGKRKEKGKGACSKTTTT